MAVATGVTSRARAPLALVAARIAQEALREDTSAADLGRLASSDPGFALRVLAAVNSAAFGVARRVGDVKHACSMLGVRGLRNIALGLVVTDMVPAGSPAEALLGNSLLDEDPVYFLRHAPAPRNPRVRVVRAEAPRLGPAIAWTGRSRRLSRNAKSCGSRRSIGCCSCASS